ncbi:MAG: ABC transporter permease subunit [Anaerolineales bacterium]
MWVIARLTVREAVRRRIVWAALGLGLVFLALFGLGFRAILLEVSADEFTSRIGMSEFFNFFMMAGLYVVNFLMVMMSVLTSVDTLSGEIASGTIQTLLAKPVRRWEILAGKWLGFTAMLAAYLVLMAGGVQTVIFALSGYAAPNALRGLGLLWLTSQVLLCLSLAGGAYLSTLANGVLAFGLFGVAFVGGWVEQFGSFAGNQSAVNIGIVSSLLLPTEALWKRAAFEMQSPLVAAMGFSPFSSPSVPSRWMVVYAGVYVLALLYLAGRQFSQRDL